MHHCVAEAHEVAILGQGARLHDVPKQVHADDGKEVEQDTEEAKHTVAWGGRWICRVPGVPPGGEAGVLCMGCEDTGSGDRAKTPHCETSPKEGTGRGLQGGRRAQVRQPPTTLAWGVAASAQPATRRHRRSPFQLESGGALLLVWCALRTPPHRGADYTTCAHGWGARSRSIWAVLTTRMSQKASK